MTRLLRPEHNGLRVYVYFNLHKHMWSVKALEGENKGKVIGHANNLVLSDCVFKVSEAGRQRVLRTQRKNVHAGVQGMLNMFTLIPSERAHKVIYNPYKYSTFVHFYSEIPVHNASVVTLDIRTGVQAYNVA